MADSRVTEVFNCTVPQFWKLISDYEKYPDFLAEVKTCKVSQTQNNRKLVKFEINMIKTFSYELWMIETEPNEIRWEFAGGDLFKSMNGAWGLADEAGKTRATYTVDAKFKIFVPGPVAKALVNVNLPNMMGAYQKRVTELYGNN